jgi:hypothetical protein
MILKKFIFLICLILLICNSFQAQDKNDDRFFIRGGLGVQGGVSFFFPKDLNEYTQDFWDHLTEQYYSWGYDGNDPIMPIFMGVNYNFKAVIRVINWIQVEGWKEKFIAMGLKFESNFYSYGWGNDNMKLNANYEFKPSYSAYGLNLLITPGARRKPVFFTAGAGFGFYSGMLEYHEDGYQTINENTIYFNDSREYTGDIIGYNGILGLTFVPWKYLELETFLTGRLAKIPELTCGNEVFNNSFRDNEPVSLDFSGFDIKLGIKFIVP